MQRTERDFLGFASAALKPVMRQRSKRTPRERRRAPVRVREVGVGDDRRPPPAPSAAARPGEPRAGQPAAQHPSARPRSRSVQVTSPPTRASSSVEAPVGLAGASGPRSSETSGFSRERPSGIGAVDRYDPPSMELIAIGHVESPLTGCASAPKQGDEGAPDAWLVFDEAVRDGLEGLAGRRRDPRAHLARPRVPRRAPRAPARRLRRAGARASSARARPTGRTRSACTA